jgi:broad specificity phosphatase PhoE
MRILLVRHGESLGNVDKQIHETTADHAVPLSAQGIKQALEAGKFLKEYFAELYQKQKFITIYDGLKAPLRVRLWVSPYRRTRETADSLQKEASILFDRREHILLCEQQFGLFDGIPNKDLPKRFPDAHAHYKKLEQFEGRFWARMPMGESRFDVATRVHQAFGTFHRDASKHHVNTIVVVCHGVTLRAFVMMWCRLTPEWFEAEPNPSNCAIRLIEGSEDKGYIFEGFPRQEPRKNR